MMKILEEKDVHWNSIGQQLGVSYGYRSSLRNDPSMPQTINKLEAVLHKWVEEKSPVTWENFKEALVKAKLMDCVGKMNSILLNKI